ncbi:MAG: hypothetical protein DME11_12030 [Candidatus Rokuibacteriota bacterium]|nr:MAG: hypothetical protein DME11_12030 [Candidatus Rokubacteria bacterium]
MDVMSFCRACACGTNSTRTSKSFCDWLKRWASDSTSAVRLGSGTLNWNRTGWAPHARRGPTRGSSHHARSAAATTPDATSVLRSCRRERTQRSSIVCLLSNGGVAVTWSREECQDRWLAYYLRVIAETTLGALAALGSALTWAVTSLLARSLQPGLGSVVVNAARSTVGGALLLGWVAATVGVGAFAAASTSALALLALSIVTAIAIGDTVCFESMHLLGVGRAMTIAMTYPVGATALAAAFLGEPITLPIVAGALLTLGGIVLIVAPWAERTPDERFWLGVGMATLASLAWAVSAVLLKPPLREMDAVTTQAIRLPLAAIVLWATPWARVGASGLGRTGGAALVRLVALGVLTALSSVMFVASVKYAGVAVSTVLSSTAPMFAIPLARVFFGERLSRTALLGASVTIAGIVVLQL